MCLQPCFLIVFYRFLLLFMFFCVLILLAYLTDMSFVRWQMSRLVSDSVPVHRHHWLSAAPDCLPSVTELFRSPLLVYGTVCRPDFVTSAPSVAVFRSRLKTHLLNISYPSPLWLYSSCAVTRSCFGHYNRSCLLTYLLVCTMDHWSDTNKWMNEWILGPRSVITSRPFRSGFVMVVTRSISLSTIVL